MGEGPCDGDSINMPSLDCRGATQLYVWAVGGNPLTFPEDVAMPLAGDSGLHYALLEIHYDNPMLRQDIVDSSGVRVYVQPTPRQYEMGTLAVALAISPLGQWIPPGLDNAHNVAFLPKDCSTNAIPDDGINIFGSFLHQHGIGKALKARHMRNGYELEPMDVNLNYDFNYQQTVIFDDHKKLMPGDEMILDCYMDSTTRTGHTIGGLSSSEEMCVLYLMYYPATNDTITYSMVQKSDSAFKEWMFDAQTEGYLSGNADDINQIFEDANYDYMNGLDFGSLTYYSNRSGAQDFYNRMYSVDYPEYNKHDVYCATGNNFTYNVAQPRDENFIEYDLGELECENIISAQNTDEGVCEYSSVLETTEFYEDIRTTNDAKAIVVYLSLSITIFCILYL